MRVLLFTLYAPIAAFGEPAVGERRMSWPRPGRSAVMGMVAAAMGHERDAEEAHQRLEAELHYAVRTDAPGTPFVDYHTAQTPRKAGATRREELATGIARTVLSTREHRADAYFTVAMWSRTGTDAGLDGIALALRRPRFVLYAGRKAAPLGLPLNPVVVEADGFLAALDARQPTAVEHDVLSRLPRDEPAGSAWVACDADATGIPGEFRREWRRDGLLSRTRHQFREREEAVFLWTTEGCA